MPADPRAPWTLLHAGALGDLALAVRFALRYARPARLTLVARSTLGALDGWLPPIARVSSETAGTAWLFGAGDSAAPAALRAVIASGNVLSFLAAAGPGHPSRAAHGPVSPHGGATHEHPPVTVDPHGHLQALGPAQLVSIDPRPVPGDARHILDQWADAWRAPAGGDSHPGAPPGDTLTPARECRAPEVDVVIHPGSGGRDKCWPLPAYQDVANRLRGAGLSVRFLIGEVERERTAADDLARLQAEFEVYEPAPTALPGALAAARCFLGNDAGPTHLAALLARPTVALFGPTNPRVWAPPGAHVRVIHGDPRLPAWGLTPAGITAAVRAALTPE